MEATKDNKTEATEIATAAVADLGELQALAQEVTALREQIDDLHAEREDLLLTIKRMQRAYEKMRDKCTRLARAVAAAADAASDT